MDVQNAVRKGRDHRIAEQTHEPGETDEIDIARAEGFDKRAIVGATIPELPVIEAHGFKADVPRPRKPRRLRAIGDDDGDHGRQPAFHDRAMNCLKIAAASGDEHGKTRVGESHGGGYASR